MIGWSKSVPMNSTDRLNNYFQTESWTFNRIIGNITLNSLMPSIQPNLTTKIIAINSTLTSPFNFNLMHTNSEIIFLTSFEKSTQLKVNLNLNVNYLGDRFEKKVVIEYEIKNLNYDINNIIEFDVKNTTINQVLLSELEVLKYFRTILWRKYQFLFTTENNKLEIASIKPGKQAGTFRFAIGSELGLSEKLLEFLSIKDLKSEQCSKENEDVKDFETKTGLQFDLCSIEYRHVKREANDGTTYEVFANFDVQINDRNTFFLPYLQILTPYSIIAIGAACVLSPILIVVIYKIIQRYFSNFSSKKEST